MKDPIALEDKSGVFRLQCNDCPVIYVGQSGRKIKDRISEHERAVRLNTPEKSPFAAHLLASGHTFEETVGTRLLHREDTYRKRIALENLEIKKASFDKKFIIVNEEIPPSILADAIYGRGSMNNTSNIK